ncbi:hypothetical protein [Mesorhizobium sp. WSM4906]|uniref:hypothetical protein n=1 Tax=Mesorhizobium sp. WSM4906 TaxID=3038546 RepID=UPI002415CED9|nr:hypothetical protein [Mesorhizobium sp. WSM4906]WFP75835.1 hypothetical protein QAZ22_29745 [Mesorhizobium sp. WSM4906]
MTTKNRAISAAVLAAAIGVSGQALAGDRHHHRLVEQERYVPAEGDLIDILFGGPRYYDAMLVTSAAGACSYHRTGPDANALNKINDHHCGK